MKSEIIESMKTELMDDMIKLSSQLVEIGEDPNDGRSEPCLRRIIFSAGRSMESFVDRKKIIDNMESERMNKESTK